MVRFTNRGLFGCLLVVWSLLLSPPVRAEEKVEDPDEALLRQAKVGTDTSSILTYLRSRSESDEDLLNIDKLIQQLGTKSFKHREEAEAKLLKLELAGLTQLRKAVTVSDREIKTRARRCVETIEARTQLAVPLVAVRMLLRRQPPELVSVLLRYLPFAGNEEVEEEIAFGLDDLAKKDAKVINLLAKGLKDPVPWRRAVAGCIVGRIGTKEQQDGVRRLLKDPDPMVRLRLAQGLLASKDKSVVSVLIELLEMPSVYGAWQAEELLHWLAGEAAAEPKVGAGGQEQQGKCRRAWERWWQNCGKQLDPTTAEFDLRRPGLLQVSGYDRRETTGKNAGHNRVWLCGCDGLPRWQINNLAPQRSFGFLLPGEQVAVGEIDSEGDDPKPAHQLRIQDLHGKILWKYEDEHLTDAQRLPNGQLFVISDGVYTVGINGASERNPLWEDQGKTRRLRRLDWAQRLDNGDILLPKLPGIIALVYDSQTGLEKTWFAIPRQPEHSRVWGMRPLPGNRYLVQHGPGNELAEYERSGRRLWGIQLPDKAELAFPLRNGNVIASRLSWQDVKLTEIIEIDRQGRRVWESSIDSDSIYCLERNEFEFVKILPCHQLVRLGFDGPRKPGNDVEQVSYLATLLKSKRLSAKRLAALRLSRLEEKAEPALNELIQALKDPDSRVRCASAKALGGLGKKAEAAIPEMVKMLGDERWGKVDDAVAKSIYRIGPKGIAPLLAAMNHADAEVQTGAAGALSLFLNDGSLALDQYLALLPGKPETIQSYLVGQLELVPRKQRSRVFPLLLKYAQDYDHPTIAGSAIVAIGRFGSDAKEALPILKRLSTENRLPASERRLAESALKVIEKELKGRNKP